MLAITIAILVAQLVIIIGGYYVYRKSRELVNQGAEVLKDLFLPGNDGQLSAFGQAVDSVTDSISQKIGVTTQAALRGSLGGSMKAVNAELEKEGAAADPAAAALTMLPKSLRKNPVAMIGLQSVISRFLQGGASSSGGYSGNNSGQAKFNL